MTQQVYQKKVEQAINDFFNCAKPHEYIEANNEIINIFLERALNESDPFSEQHTKNVVFIITQQSKLISQLCEASFDSK
jgi:hypothetical protein